MAGGKYISLLGKQQQESRKHGQAQEGRFCLPRRPDDKNVRDNWMSRVIETSSYGAAFNVSSPRCICVDPWLI